MADRGFQRVNFVPTNILQPKFHVAAARHLPLTHSSCLERDSRLRVVSVVDTSNRLQHIFRKQVYVCFRFSRIGALAAYCSRLPTHPHTTRTEWRQYPHTATTLPCWPSPTQHQIQRTRIQPNRRIQRHFSTNPLHRLSVVAHFSNFPSRFVLRFGPTFSPLQCALL